MGYLKSKFEQLFLLEVSAAEIAKSEIFSTFVYLGGDIDLDDRLSLATKYLRSEAKLGLWKSPVFDLASYRAALERRKIRGVGNYLLHYLKFGWKMDLSPNDFINVTFYKKEAENKGLSVDREVFEHYQNIGYKDNLSPSLFFDNDWYRQVNRTDQLHISPFFHFLKYGSDQKLSPTFCFSVSHLESRLDTKFVSTIDALKAYIEACGRATTVNPHIIFDEYFYRSNNDDVKQSKMTSVEHFTHYGIWEGRSPINISINKSDLSSKTDNNYFTSVARAGSFELKDQFLYYDYLDKLNTLRSDLGIKDQAVYQRPLAIITTFNDSDCIKSILLANIREGLSIWLIDNWSTDGTWEIIQSLCKEAHIKPFIEEVERYPVDGASQHYDWSGMLGRKEEIAEKFVGRWILHQDSDEITVSPISNITCAECFRRIQLMGYNTVNMRMFDFRPINSDEPGEDIEESFSHFEFSKNISYGLQIKAWLQPTGRVELKNSGGHRVEFLGSSIFPLRLPRKHYSIRSVAHGKRKVFKERKPRFEKERLEKGWHTHYDQEISDSDFIWDKSILYNYSISGHAASWFNMLFNKEV